MSEDSPELQIRGALAGLLDYSQLELACHPLMERPECLGRLLAPLGRSVANAVLKKVAGIRPLASRTGAFLSLVFRSAKSPTTELREAVLMALSALDTVAESRPAWERLLAEAEKGIASLVEAHLNTLPARRAQHVVTGGWEVPFVLAVASAVSRPTPMGGDGVAIELFGQTLRPATQFTALTLAANMFWGFTPYAGELLGRAAEAVGGELARRLGAAPSVEGSGLRKSVVATVAASRLVGLRTPVDFPVRLEFSLASAGRSTYLSRLTLNYVSADAKAFASSDDAYVKLSDGRTYYPLHGYLLYGYKPLFEGYGATSLARARRLSDVVALYAQGAAEALSYMREVFKGLLSIASFRIAAAEAGYEDVQGDCVKDISRGVALAFRCWPEDVPGGQPAVAAKWRLIISVRRAFGRGGEDRLARELGVYSVMTREAFSRVALAITDGIGGVEKVDIDAGGPMVVLIQMKPKVIVASDYVELYRRAAGRLGEAEATARRMVMNLGGLLGAAGWADTSGRRRNADEATEGQNSVASAPA